MVTRVLNRHIGFQNIGLPNPVVTVENLTANNPTHATNSKSVHIKRMVLNPLLQNIRRLLDQRTTQCKPAQVRTILKDFWVSAKH